MKRWILFFAFAVLGFLVFPTSSCAPHTPAKLAPAVLELAADDCVDIAEIHDQADVEHADHVMQACSYVRDLAPLLKRILAQRTAGTLVPITHKKVPKQ
jgi:hypothetical protein